MTADLVAFLRARLDEEQRMVEAIDSAPWWQGQRDAPEWDRDAVSTCDNCEAPLTLSAIRVGTFRYCPDCCDPDDDDDRLIDDNQD